MSITNIIKDPQTNWKYILIVLVLAVLVGGGILGWQYWSGREVPVPTPTPTPTPLEGKSTEKQKSYIKVISPSDGEKWIAGKIYDVVWESNGIGKVVIYFGWESTDHPAGGEEPVTEEIMANKGKFSLTIPSNILPYDSYQICVKEAFEWIKLSDKISVPKERAYAGDCMDGYLTIVWENRPTPFIDIISPKDGDNLKANERYDIVWESQGVDNVGIYASGGPVPGGWDHNDIVYNIAATQGKYSWEVPSSYLTRGSYELYIMESRDRDSWPYPAIIDTIRINVIE